MIRLLIADGDDKNLAHLRRTIHKRSDWRVCGEAMTGLEAVELAVQLSPDIVILALALPGLNGLEAARRIKRLRPETEIVAVMTQETDDLIRDLLSAGVQACLLKEQLDDHLSAAVGALSQHRPYFTPSMAHELLDFFLEHGADAAPSQPILRLTPREREILQLLVEGRGNAAIASLLGISVKTVETHRATIMKKLGVSSLAELVRYAIRNRVIHET